MIFGSFAKVCEADFCLAMAAMVFGLNQGYYDGFW